MNKKIIKKLIDYEEEDQKLLLLCHRAIDTGNALEIESANKDYSLAQNIHLNYLDEHLDKIISVLPNSLGNNGITALFLLIQHSGRLDLMNKILPLIKKASEDGVCNRRLFALLTDRIRLNEGKPQLYGTQRRTDKISKKQLIYEFLGSFDDVELRRIRDNINTDGYLSFKDELIKHNIIPDDFDFKNEEIPSENIAYKK